MSFLRKKEKYMRTLFLFRSKKKTTFAVSLLQ